MKNKPVFIFIFIIIFYSLLFLLQKNDVYTQRIENKNFKLLIADSPDEHAKGLMNVRKLDNAEGMVFFFKDHKTRTFWNQNTLIDIDVYWMKDDMIVGKSFLPSIEKTKVPTTVFSPQPVNKVVEIIRK